MKNIKAKYFLQVFLPLLVLLSSVCYNAYSYQSISCLDSTSSSIQNDFENTSSAYLIGSVLPEESPFDLYLCEIEEVKKVEETNDDKRSDDCFIGGLFANGPPENGSINTAPLTLPIGASCQSVNKYILFLSFKLDC